MGPLSDSASVRMHAVPPGSRVSEILADLGIPDRSIPLVFGIDPARDGADHVVVGVVHRHENPCPHLGGTADCPTDHLQIYGGVFAGRVWTGQDVAGQPLPRTWVDESLALASRAMWTNEDEKRWREEHPDA